MLTPASSQAPSKLQYGHTIHFRNKRGENVKNKYKKTSELRYTAQQVKEREKNWKNGHHSPPAIGRWYLQSLWTAATWKPNPPHFFLWYYIFWGWCYTAWNIPLASLDQLSWQLVTLPTSCPPPAYWIWGRVGKIKSFGPVHALLSKSQNTHVLSTLV